MASLRQRVTLAGILRGKGQEVPCTILATKVSLPGPDNALYCEYSVMKISQALPEGSYQLSVNAEIIPLRFRNGYWMSTGMA